MRPRTRAAYLSYVVAIGRHYECDPATLNEERVGDYLLFLRKDRCYAPSSLSIVLAALRGFYRDHLGSGADWKLWREFKVRRQAAPPVVLSREEVARVLSHVQCARFRTILELIYHCGLRISEACQIEVRDLREAKHGRLLVREGKGGRGRRVPIAPMMTKRLRKFWARHRNPRWLFPGIACNWRAGKEAPQILAGRATKPMSASSVQGAFRLARAAAGVCPEATPHTLRHSYATHMLEESVSIRLISNYLGHASLETTMIYLHVTEVNEGRAVAALERLCAQALGNQKTKKKQS